MYEQHWLCLKPHTYKHICTAQHWFLFPLLLLRPVCCSTPVAFLYCVVCIYLGTLTHTLSAHHGPIPLRLTDTWEIKKHSKENFLGCNFRSFNQHWHCCQLQTATWAFYADQTMTRAIFENLGGSIGSTNMSCMIAFGVSSNQSVNSPSIYLHLTSFSYFRPHKIMRTCCGEFWCGEPFSPPLSTSHHPQRPKPKKRMHAVHHTMHPEFLLVVVSFFCQVWVPYSTRICS